MLRLNVESLKQAVANYDGIRTVGRLRSARGVLSAQLVAGVGELCQLQLPRERSALAEVIGFDGDMTQIMCFQRCEGVKPGQEIISLGRPHRVPVGWGLMGRVLDGLGAPIDEPWQDWPAFSGPDPNA